MNPIIRLARRVYQKAFHAVIYLLNFPTPELLEGRGAIARLPSFIKGKGFTRVLVVTDKGLMGARLLDGLFAGLDAAGISWFLFDGVQPNPSIQNIEDARALYAAKDCQAIIAFGGGSAMDCAKAAGARIANPRKSVSRLRGQLKVWRRPPALFAVPTTAGTGSETTVAAIVSDPSTHEKYAISDPRLIPPYAVLDPELTVKLPPHITSTTGMDALTHAVEAYIGRSSTKATREASEEAVRLIFANLEQAWASGGDLLARERMLKASFLAGFAFTRAYVGYVHAIAHNLGGLYGIPHGLANAVILPHVLDWYGKSAAAPLARLARVAGLPVEGKTEAEAAAAFIAAIRGLNSRMGIQDSFSQILEKDLPLIVTRAFREAHPDYPVPRFMERKDCEAVLRRLMA
jgi:alcohol dehydrogenase class IV